MQRLVTAVIRSCRQFHYEVLSHVETDRIENHPKSGDG